MNRVYQIVEDDEKVPLQFSSKAESIAGVFRSFSKSHFKYLKYNMFYSLFALDCSSTVVEYKKVGYAFWNGKSFIPFPFKPSNPFCLV